LLRKEKQESKKKQEKEKYRAKQNCHYQNFNASTKYVFHAAAAKNSIHFRSIRNSDINTSY